MRFTLSALLSLPLLACAQGGWNVTFYPSTGCALNTSTTQTPFTASGYTYNNCTSIPGLSTSAKPFDNSGGYCHFYFYTSSDCGWENEVARSDTPKGSCVDLDFTSGRYTGVESFAVNCYR